MRVGDYKELRVYRLACESAMEIFELSRRWPAEEKFSLTDQIRRSSRSVCTNMAEAWRKRRYEAAFVSKLSDSDGEAAETEVHLEFALSCRYVSRENHARLRDHYDHICRQLWTIIDDSGSWCGTTTSLYETAPEYPVGIPQDAESVKNKPHARDVNQLHAPDALHAPHAAHASDAPRSRRS